jgi:nicotinate-nucleotide adenylyltransferase
MTRLAVADNPAFEASDLETSRGGRSYAVDTLRRLRATRPDDEFFFIIGQDAFADIASWREAAALFSLTSFLVIPRPGAGRTDLLGGLPPGVSARPLAGSRWRTTAGGEIHLADLPLLEVSSSAIRSRVARGLSVRYLVPDAVAAYMAERRLYQPETKESPCP